MKVVICRTTSSRRFPNSGSTWYWEVYSYDYIVCEAATFQELLGRKSEGLPALKSGSRESSRPTVTGVSYLSPSFGMNNPVWWGGNNCR